ncbi:MAG: class IV adenylate cyclase [Desulfovibrio sp.]|nr:class IV adenylate cyclase [Desulfovibrio sp.]
MALEIERKYLGLEQKAFEDVLEKAGYAYSGVFFERNLVFETSPPSLRNQGILLRLRSNFSANGLEHILTLKTKVPGKKGLKIREEIESRVSDEKAMRTILRGLGFTPHAAYEKVRAVWHAAGAEIVLDRLPFGFFVEIEGEEDAISGVEKACGLCAAQTSTASYHELHRTYQKSRGLPETLSFVFSDAERRDLLLELGIRDELAFTPLSPAS